MTHEDYKELLAAKALTALDAEDARSLNTHLESCAACHLELGEWEETASLLALEAASLEPSAQLRRRILESVRGEQGKAESVNDRAKVPDEYAAGASDAKVLAFERRPRNVWSSLGSFGAIAASVLVVVLIGSLVVLWQQNLKTQSDLARLSNELRQAREQLARERKIGLLLTSPGAHMAALAGTNVAPGAHAMLAYDKTGHAMLMATGLPAAPQGMAYQLWYIKDNQKMPGKVFATDAVGNGMLEDQIPAVARDAAVFAVTLEPAAGVEIPTGSIYLLST
jgi:anti-sigma-K factor RskA